MLFPLFNWSILGWWLLDFKQAKAMDLTLPYLRLVVARFESYGSHLAEDAPRCLLRCPSSLFQWWPRSDRRTEACRQQPSALGWLHWMLEPDWRSGGYKTFFSCWLFILVYSLRLRSWAYPWKGAPFVKALVLFHFYFPTTFLLKLLNKAWLSQWSFLDIGNPRSLIFIIY